MNAELTEKCRASLAKAAEYLRSQQAQDGGWHSQTYGQLKDGAGATALVLYAISYLPPEVSEKIAGAVARGFAFLDQGIAKRKSVASPDGSLDYPTYASAMWLTARRRLTLPARPEQESKLRDYLLS